MIGIAITIGRSKRSQPHSRSALWSTRPRPTSAAKAHRAAEIGIWCIVPIGALCEQRGWTLGGWR